MKREKRNKLTVFTKPWKRLCLRDLASLVKELGFDGVELAVRAGYQVEPETALEKLTEAVEIFGEEGLSIESVASELSERMVEACARAKVPLLRTMLPIDPELGYRASVAGFIAHSHRLEPFLKGTGLKIGVQNHCGHFVGSALGLMEALSELNEAYVAVLDLAHTSLAGELEPYALEIAKPRLELLNLKNAYLVKKGENAHGEAIWDRRWVSGKEGITSWSLVVELIRKQGYTGPICLTAEYKDADGNAIIEEDVLPLIRADLSYLKDLLSS